MHKQYQRGRKQSKGKQPANQAKKTGASKKGGNITAKE